MILINMNLKNFHQNKIYNEIINKFYFLFFNFFIYFYIKILNHSDV